VIDLRTVMPDEDDQLVGSFGDCNIRHSIFVSSHSSIKEGELHLVIACLKKNSLP
jgi:hypothetical protein